MQLHLEPLLYRCHPRVYRIALALCGDRGDAERVVEQVLIRSGPISSRWETEDQAIRWFVHYTVLRSRDCSAVRPEKDALLNAATRADFAALIAAVRQLPMQQREAFFLHHGEHLELRQLATAMDCSSAAAANHLAGAVKALNSLTDGGLGDFTTQLPEMMTKLVPTDEVLEFQIRRILARRRKWVWTRRILKLFGWIIAAIFVAGIAWVLGRILHQQL